ncbi:aldehyde dehydrogenase family 3 member F1 [Quercus suber]|uniref:aldehyde dehydrogenase family 3 member F1 n=1 Tax=Quercus suber TaxID=58331 RepID=UPI0032DEBD4F
MEELENSLGKLRQCFRSGRTRSVAWRKNQLRAVLKLIHDKEDVIFEALQQDLGKHPVESYRDEIGVVKKSANYALSNIKKWMAPKKQPVPLLFFPSKGEVLPEPYGVVLIFGSWNFPICESNRFLICSEIELLWSQPIYMSFKNHFATTACLVLAQFICSSQTTFISEGLERESRIAGHFPPNSRVTGVKFFAAAQLLTFICSTQNHFNRTVIQVKRRILARKEAHAGACSDGFMTTAFPADIAPINGSSATAAFKKMIICIWIITVHTNNLYIEPTILLNPPLNADIMNEEIFGPLLPIITVDNIRESVDFINSRPKPLAIYAFTEDETFKRQILAETSSGSVTFNDVLVQFLCDALPFGGVGQSGIGRYHGKYSFDTFSHEKTVMQRAFFPELEPRYPPWNDFKLKFIRLAYDFDYLGILLLMLNLKR